MAKKDLSPDKIQLELVIDGTPARKALAETTQEMVKLKQQQKDLIAQEKELNEQRKAARASGDTKEVTRLTGEIGKLKDAKKGLATQMVDNQKKQETMRSGMSTLEMSLSELTKKARELRAQWNAGLGGQEQLQRTASQLREVEERIKMLGTAQGRALMLWEQERQGIDLNRMSLEQLALEQQRWERIKSTAVGDSAEYTEAAAGLDQVRDRQQQLTNSNRQAEEAWKRVRESMLIDDMSVEQLKMEKKALEEIMSTLPRTSAEFDKLARELNDVERELMESTSATALAEKEWEKMRGSLRMSEMSMEQLRQEIAFLDRAKAKLNPTKDAAAMNLYSRSLNDAKAHMKRLESGMGPFARMWSEVRSSVMGAGAIMGGMFAGQALIGGARNMVRASAELSDAISDVKKTTGLSTPVVRELSKELSAIDTRTSRAELLALARDAGKLGITAKEDILQFVRAGNQINVALGEDLGADAIKSIGKLVDLFKLKDQFGLEQGMLKVGSAINELGMSSTASEGYMVQFMQRMGGIAPLAGITVDQTLALGATLDSLGQTSEVSSTALSKMFVQMGSDAEKYAAIAGMSTERFTEILKKNALEAFIAVLDGTKKTEGGVVALAETLGDMGIDAARAAGVFGVLGANTDRLREQMGIANKAFQEGTSLTNEYDEKNNNLAATLEKLGKQFNRLIANNTIIDWMTGLVGATKSVMDWLQRNAIAIQFMAKILATAGAAWVSYRLAAVLSTKASAIAATVTRTVAMAKALLATNTMTAGRAMVFFSTAVKTSPLGFLAGALTTVAGLFWSFGQEVDEASSALGTQAEELNKLYRQTLATNKGTEERRKLFEQMKQMYPDHLGHLDADKTSNQQLAEAIGKVNTQLINKQLLQKDEAKLAEAREKALAAGGKAADTEQAVIGKMEDMAKKYKLNLDSIFKDGTTTMQKLQELEKQVAAAGGDAPKWIYMDRQHVRGASDTEIITSMRQGLEEQRGVHAEERAALAQQEAAHEAYARRLGLIDANANKEAKANADEGLKTLTDITAEIERLKAILAASPYPKVSDVVIHAQITDLEKQRDAMAAQAGQTVAAGAQTIKQIDEAIKNFREQQESASSRSKFDAIEAEIKRLQRARDRITGVTKTGKPAKAAEDLTKLLAEYKQFQEDLVNDTKNADEQALAQLDRKHTEELEKVREQQQKLIKAKKLTQQQADTDNSGLRSNQAQERVDLIEAQGQRRSDEVKAWNDKIRDLLYSANSQFLGEEMARIDNETGLNQERISKLNGLEAQRHVAQKRIYQQNALTALAAEADKWDDVIEVARKKLQEYDDALAKEGTEPSDEDMATRQQLADGIIDLERARNLAVESINKDHRLAEQGEEEKHQTALLAIKLKHIQRFTLLANATNDAMQGMLQWQDAGIAAAETRADADGERTEEEIAQIDRLKEARRQAALTAIAVQGAAAIANGVASAMTLQPWPLAVASALSTVGIIMGLMAQARNLMNASSSSSSSGRGQQAALQDVPLGETGGIGNADGFSPFSKSTTGVLQGSSHAQKGIAMIDNRTGKQVAELEGGEAYAVLSKAFVKNNADILPALFQASREGKRMAPFDRQPATPNLGRVQQAMGVAHMAQGGVVTTTSANGIAWSTRNDEESNTRSSTNDRMLELLTSLVAQTTRTATAAERFPTQLVARASTKDFDRRMVETQRIKDIARGRNSG